MGFVVSLLADNDFQMTFLAEIITYFAGGFKFLNIFGDFTFAGIVDSYFLRINFALQKIVFRELFIYKIIQHGPVFIWRTRQ